MILRCRCGHCTTQTTGTAEQAWDELRALQPIRRGAGSASLPWVYFDDTVQVELRATRYPYGGGRPGVGVQLTLESRHNGVTVAVRLPADVAYQLAYAILAGGNPETAA